MRRWVYVAAACSFVLGACSSTADDTKGDEVGGASPGRITEAADTSDCGWSQAGAGPERFYATACADTITEDNVGRMSEQWFFPTPMEVTGAPAVDESQLYFGDWSGRFYAVDRATGTQSWTYDVDPQPNVYAGQITASPALATIGDRDVVIFGGARGVYALDRSTGEEVWRHTIGNPADPDDRTEFEGAAAVAGDVVVIGYDVHNRPGQRAGVLGIDLASGQQRWYRDFEAGRDAQGCGDVWGAVAIDLEAGRAILGTANCPRPEFYGPYTEAIVSLSLADGSVQWSYQPHEQGSMQDWDFAGAPNLFEIDGDPVVGLGNKDGFYYVVDRNTGKLVWKAEAQRQAADGDGFAFGGFIGATAVSAGAVVGATAIGDCPCVHAFDAATGETLWRNNEPSGTYASAAATPELVFLAGIDQTLRAFRISDGKIMWDSALQAVSSSGAAIAGRDLYIGVGFREPGSESESQAAGVHAFRALAPGEKAAVTTTTTTAPTGPAVTALEPVSQRCVGEPCDLSFEIKAPPAGTTPKITVQIQPDPLSIDVKASGLGKPAAWLREGSAAARDGAKVYGVIVSPRDDQPEEASLVCTFTENEDGCRSTRIAKPADKFTRLSVVALVDDTTLPTLQDGFDRLVTTQGFDIPLVPKG